MASGQLAILLLCLPWIKNLIFLVNLEKIMPVRVKFHNEFKVLIDSLLSFAGHWIRPLSLIEILLYCFLIISAMVCFKNTKDKKNILDFSRHDYLLFVWIFTPITLLYIMNIVYAPVNIFKIRHLGIIHVPLIIMLSKAINKYNNKIKFILLIFLAFSIALKLRPYYRESLKINGQNWRQLHEELYRVAGKNDLIVYLRDKFVKLYYGREIKTKSIDRSEFERANTDKLNYDSIFLVYKYKRQ